MGREREPGPLCQVTKPKILADGTTCPCESPLPGPVGKDLDILDHFIVLGLDANKPAGQEGWFERRYPNLLESTRRRFVRETDGWVLKNWRSESCPDQKLRESVVARDTRYQGADGKMREVFKDDDRFGSCGDQPQDSYEADKVLGAFAVDIKTPIKIHYGEISKNGARIEQYRWESVMYVEDVVGLQEDNRIVQEWGPWLLHLAPSRKVIRAKWKIRGGAWTYLVQRGDTLWTISSKLTGSATRWKEIANANAGRLASPDSLWPGQLLVLPDSVVNA